MKEFDSYESSTSKDPITLQGSLKGLTDGNHTYQVLLYGVSYYQQDYPNTRGVPSNYYIRNNSTATFSIDTNIESNASPTPSVPEFSWLIILPLFLSILFFVVLIRRRKYL